VAHHDSISRAGIPVRSDAPAVRHARRLERLHSTPHRGGKRLRLALAEAAKAAARKRDTYLASHYHQLKARRGAAKATIAVGHTILVICWHLLTTGEVYTDLGGDYIQKRRNSTARAKRLLAELDAAGYDITSVHRKAA